MVDVPPSPNLHNHVHVPGLVVLVNVTGLPAASNTWFDGFAVNDGNGTGITTMSKVLISTQS